MIVRLVLPLVAILLPSTILAEPANPSGERAFQRCFSCHSVEDGEGGLSGPNLHRLSQRRVAGDRAFAYSSAFRAFAARNPRWTPELLDRFLTDPEALVPGNEMGFFGLDKADERAAIVAYLMADE
jgi:cytochrome c2